MDARIDKYWYVNSRVNKSIEFLLLRPVMDVNNTDLLPLSKEYDPQNPLKDIEHKDQCVPVFIFNHHIYCCSPSYFSKRKDKTIETNKIVNQINNDIRPEQWFLLPIEVLEQLEGKALYNFQMEPNENYYLYLQKLNFVKEYISDQWNPGYNPNINYQMIYDFLSKIHHDINDPNVEKLKEIVKQSKNCENYEEFQQVIVQAKVLYTTLKENPTNIRVSKIMNNVNLGSAAEKDHAPNNVSASVIATSAPTPKSQHNKSINLLSDLNTKIENSIAYAAMDNTFEYLEFDPTCDYVSLNSNINELVKYEQIKFGIFFNSLKKIEYDPETKIHNNITSTNRKSKEIEEIVNQSIEILNVLEKLKIIDPSDIYELHPTYHQLDEKLLETIQRHFKLIEFKKKNVSDTLKTLNQRIKNHIKLNEIIKKIENEFKTDYLYRFSIGCTQFGGKWVTLYEDKPMLVSHGLADVVNELKRYPLPTDEDMVSIGNNIRKFLQGKTNKKLRFFGERHSEIIKLYEHIIKEFPEKPGQSVVLNAAPIIT